MESVMTEVKEQSQIFGRNWQEWTIIASYNKNCDRSEL